MGGHEVRDIFRRLSSLTGSTNLKLLICQVNKNLMIINLITSHKRSDVQTKKNNIGIMNSTSFCSTILKKIHV